MSDLRLKEVREGLESPKGHLCIEVFLYEIIRGLTDRDAPISVHQPVS